MTIMKLCLLWHLILIISPAVLAAPVELKEDGIEKRRDSTKETIELEDALKRLSGENKKFISAPLAAMPQVDGLGDDGKDSDVTALESDLGDAANDEDDVLGDEFEKQVLDLDRLQAQVNADSQSDDHVEDESAGDVSDISDVSDVRDESDENAPREADYIQPVIGEYAVDPYKDYYADIYGDMESKSPSSIDPQYGYNPYTLDDAYVESSDNNAESLADDSESRDEQDDVRLQDMVKALLGHPKLMRMLQQGQERLADEYQDYQSNQANDVIKAAAQNEILKSDTKDLYERLPVEDEADDIDASHEPVDNAQQLTQTGLSNDELNLEHKAIIKQLENLQEIYGDAQGHSVAKKMGYGGVRDAVGTGSGESNPEGTNQSNDVNNHQNSRELAESLNQLKASNSIM